MKAARRGVSELYSSMLMVGVTLVFGGIITSAAIGQFNGSTTAGALGVQEQEASAGKQVSMVYGTVVPGSGGCTSTYKGPDGKPYAEGRTYLLALYDYGDTSFSPYEVFDNGTLLAVGGYSTITAAAGGGAPAPVQNALALPSCAHPGGQTFLLIDSAGDEVALGT